MPLEQVCNRTKILFSVLFPIMLVCWNQGFDIGAFGSVLYRSAISAWVFVVSIFISLLYVGIVEKASVKKHSFFILLVPVLWPALNYFDAQFKSTYVHYFVLFDYCIVMLGLLYAASIFLRLIKADIFEPLTPGNRIFILVIAVSFTFFGYLAGKNNHLFLECAHFERSGDYIPENCHYDKDTDAPSFTRYSRGKINPN